MDLYAVLWSIDVLVQSLLFHKPSGVGVYVAYVLIAFGALTCTAHAFSADGARWTYTGTAADATARYLDGTSETYGHCERPHMLFAEDGVTPVALTNGVKIQGLSNDDQSFTLLRPLRLSV